MILQEKQSIYQKVLEHLNKRPRHYAMVVREITEIDGVRFKFSRNQTNGGLVVFCEGCDSALDFKFDKKHQKWEIFS